MKPGAAVRSGVGALLGQRLRRIFPPVVRQLETDDCGPAALLSALRFWGGDAGLGEVRQLAATSSRGSSLLGLRDAAMALGLEARGARGELEDLGRERLPCIAHLILDDGRAHFISVTSVRARHVRVVDPARGRRRLGRREFERLWRSRAVLLLSPTPRIRRDAPAHRWPSWWLRHLLAEPAWLAQALFLGVASTGLGLVTAIFIRWLVDRFIPGRDVTMVAATGVALAILLLLRVLAGHLRRRYLLHLARSVASRSTDEFLSHLYRLPIGFFESRPTGDLTTRFSDGTRTHRAILEMGSGILTDGLVALGTVGFLFAVAPRLGPVAATTLPLYVVALAASVVRVHEKQADALAAYSRAESGLIESLEAIEEVHTFARGRFFARRTARLFDVFLERSERLGITHASIDSVSELLAGAVVVGALSWGAFLVVGGDLMLGQLMAGYSLLASAAPSVDRLVRACVALRELSVPASRFTHLLDVPEESRGGRARVSISKELRLENVGMRWAGERRLFAGLDLSLPVGRVTGLTGANGTGKTTLVRLLGRACAPDEGRVMADGIPVEELDLDAYRREVAVFRSDTHLFQGTLAANVLLGRHERDASEALGRVAGFGFERFVRGLPLGWETPVGRGGQRLSSGERQAVGLMRALVGSPAVVLVDEGVTATDRDLTRSMLEALTRYGRDHAVLLVSHEPSILRCVDRLVVLAEGRVAREGPPEQALATSAPPGRSWTSHGRYGAVGGAVGH